MRSRREFLCGAAAVAFAPKVFAAKQWTTLRVIVKDEKGNPVPHASVVIREVKGKKQNKFGDAFELKTGQEGEAPMPPIHRGRVMIQVIQKGFKTHGEQVDLVELEQIHSIVLEAPKKQFSVHTP